MMQINKIQSKIKEKRRTDMGKLIAFLLIVAACVYCYYNVDFSNFKQNATQTFQKEKTINVVQQGRQQQREAVEKALDY